MSRITVRGCRIGTGLDPTTMPSANARDRARTNATVRMIFPFTLTEKTPRYIFLSSGGGTVGVAGALFVRGWALEGYCPIHPYPDTPVYLFSPTFHAITGSTAQRAYPVSSGQAGASPLITSMGSVT